MSSFFYVVSRGRGAGTVLTPHRYADGLFVVSKTRFAADQLRVTEGQLEAHVSVGFALRMSNPGVLSHKAPSLIASHMLERREEINAAA